MNPSTSTNINKDLGGFGTEPVTCPEKDVISMDTLPSWTLLANWLLVRKMDMITLACMALCEQFHEVRALLGLKDDFGFKMLNSHLLLNTEEAGARPFPSLPEGKLKATAVEKAGYRLLFDPEGDMSSLGKYLKEIGGPHVLTYLVERSDITGKHPWVKRVTNAIIKNGGGSAVMNFKDSAALFDKAGHTKYQKTPCTNRDFSVLLFTMNATTFTSAERKEAWSMALRIIEAMFKAAQSLDSDALFLPELLELSAETRAYAEMMFERHEDMFNAGEARIRSGEIKPIGRDFLNKNDGVNEIGTAFRIIGKPEWYHGAVFLRTYTDNGRDHTSQFMPKVVRKISRENLKQNPPTEHYSQCPIITVRYEPQENPAEIKTYIQTDTTRKQPLDLTFLVRDIRIAEVKARKDLSPATKKKVLADESILTAKGAPNYTKEKRSHMIFGGNGLTMGNAYAPHNPTLPMSQEELDNLIANSINQQYKKFGP